VWYGQRSEIPTVAFAVSTTLPAVDRAVRAVVLFRVR
jgi:hypothetical protein